MDVGKSRITGEIKGTQSMEENRVQIVLRSNIKCMRGKMKSEARIKRMTVENKWCR